MQVLRQGLQSIWQIDFSCLWLHSHLLTVRQVGLDRVGVGPIKFPTVLDCDNRVVSWRNAAEVESSVGVTLVGQGSISSLLSTGWDEKYEDARGWTAVSFDDSIYGRA